jgi:hypothetical protein
LISVLKSLGTLVVPKAGSHSCGICAEAIMRTLNRLLLAGFRLPVSCEVGPDSKARRSREKATAALPTPR